MNLSFKIFQHTSHNVRVLQDVSRGYSSSFFSYKKMEKQLLSYIFLQIQ